MDYVLESKRLVLRPAREAQLAGLTRILSDPEIEKTLLGNVSTPAGLEAEVRRWIDPPDDWQRHGFGCLGIFDRDSAFGAPDGLLGIAAASAPLPSAGQSPEISYFVDRVCWGQGVAGEAARRVCRYLFEDLRAPALEALIFAELNPGSVRLAEKLGFRAAGRVSLRQHGLDDTRLEEVIAFDLWRVRTAPTDAVPAVLNEAAFRIGQVLAEGVGAPEDCKSDLHQALAGRVPDDTIDRRLSQGMAAKGMALYRVARRNYVG